MHNRWERRYLVDEGELAGMAEWGGTERGQKVYWWQDGVVAPIVGDFCQILSPW